MNDYTIIARVRRITEAGALLDIDGQQLSWPNGKLPDGLKVGDQIRLRIQTGAGGADPEQARAILAEILGGNT